ncbi:hypothetical protein ACFQER_14345 [Halomicroarcula sp. GCM10025894]|uniref:hypothetical protein n=1 Tax=Halomicroarcula sp. GCM10025894 TaxID=3252673 RepID=UPI003605B176
MSMRTVELVSEWDTVPFDGGYDGLWSLSDQGFSGAVTTGPTQLFMLNGTVVGVLDGDIEAFDGADGTARAAPHDALPLLVVMQDRADSPRAQYYTEDTPISDVDRTLEDGSFTGYVELSENVLSGDYYMVYHQGRSMSVAWVGNSQRLITDEDAFEQADGEVGIYQVMPADIEPVEIPEPSPSADESEETVAGSATAVDGTADETVTAASGETTPDSAPAEEAAEPASEAGSDSSADDSAAMASDRPGPSDDAGPGTAAATDVAERGAGAAGPPGSKAAGASQGTAVDRTRREETNATGADSGTTAEAPATDAESATPESADPAPTETEPAPDDGGTAPARTEPAEPSGGRTTQAETADPPTDRTETVSTDESPGERQTAAAAVDSDAVSDLETRSIPSLDPERSSSTPEQTTTTTTATQSISSESPSAEPASADRSSTAGAADAEPIEPRSEASAATGDTQSAPSPELQATLESREAEIAELEGEIRDLSAENQELAAERDRLLGELRRPARRYGDWKRSWQRPGAPPRTDRRSRLRRPSTGRTSSFATTPRARPRWSRPRTGTQTERRSRRTSGWSITPSSTPRRRSSTARPSRSSSAGASSTALSTGSSGSCCTRYRPQATRARWACSTTPSRKSTAPNSTGRCR